MQGGGGGSIQAPIRVTARGTPKGLGLGFRVQRSKVFGLGLFVHVRSAGSSVVKGLRFQEGSTGSI